MRIKHIELYEDGQQFNVELHFPDKCGLKYHNRVAVEKRVFKNLELFMENKQAGEDLFDKLDVTITLLSGC